MKKIDKKQLEKIQRFLRFLKANKHYTRFMYCARYYSSNIYTLDKWLCTKEIRDFVVNVPFNWSSVNNELNSEHIWTKIDKEWGREISKQKF